MPPGTGAPLGLTFWLPFDDCVRRFRTRSPAARPVALLITWYEARTRRRCAAVGRRMVADGVDDVGAVPADGPAERVQRGVAEEVHVVAAVGEVLDVAVPAVLGGVRRLVDQRHRDPLVVGAHRKAEDRPRRPAAIVLTSAVAPLADSERMSVSPSR